MDHSTSLTRHVHASPEEVWAVKAHQGGADYTTRLDLAGRDGGMDLTVTFSADVVRPTLLSKVTMALFGKMGMSITRKALTKDLAEIAAKAESL